MPTVSELSVRVSADTAGLESGLQRANQQVSSFGSGMSSVLGGLGAGIGIKIFDTLASGLSAAGAAAIGFNDKLEQSTIAFSSMLGSGEKAKAFLDDLKQFAVATPFKFDELVDASKKMLAFGFSAKDVKPLLTAVGNAASAMGSGSDGVARITAALGQMKAATVVQKGELNQLTEVGVPAYDILSKAIGKTTQETMKLLEQGKISSDVFISAFQDWSKNNFGDLMAQQSRTFSGALSTVEDALTQATATAFEPFFKLIREGVVGLADVLSSDTFSAWGTAGAAGMQQFVDALRGGLAQAQQLWTTWIQPAIATVQGWFQTLQSQGLSAFLAQVGQWIAGAVPALAQQFAAWGGAALSWIEQALPLVGAGILSLVQSVTTWVTQNAPAIGAALVSWATSFWSWVQTATPQLLARLGAMEADLGTWIVNAAGVWAASLLTWATAFIQWITPMIPQLLAALGQVISGITGWIVRNAPTILAQLQAWAATFWAWVQPAIGPLLAALGGLLAQLGAWITSTALPAIVAYVQAWATAFSGWVAAAIPLLLGAAATLLLALGGWITNVALPEIVAKTKEWATAFVAWAAPAGEQLKQQLVSDSTTLWAEITRVYADARTKISGELQRANTYDEEQHRAFLTRMKDDGVSILGGYLQFQVQWNAQMVAGYKTAFDQVVTIHQAFWTDLTTQFPQRIGQWMGILTTYWGELTSGYQRVFAGIAQIHQQFWNGMVSLAQSMAGSVARQIDQISSALDRLMSAIDRVINRQSQVRSSSSYNFSGGGNYYASGGVIREPVVGFGVRSGERYTIGEAGPEMVTPLSGRGGAGMIAPNWGGGGGGGTTVVVNVYGNALASRRELADAVIVGLGEAQRQGRTVVRVT